MQKATATYVAPPGDSKVVEMGGVTFFDGKSVELDSYHHPELMKKLATNQNFDVVLGKEDDQPMKVEKKRGRPTNAQVAEAKAAAEKAGADAKAAAEKAKEAKADADKLTSDAGKTDAAPQSGVQPGKSIFANQQAAQNAGQLGTGGPFQNALNRPIT